MRGYKVFNPDWTCRNFQYELGKTYEINEQPICCKKGFHYCRELKDCFNYYLFDPRNKVAIVDALGDIDDEEDDSKCCTNKIKIIKELSWEEVLRLVNIGVSNTGFLNTGNWNSGHWNSGNENSGNWNSGNWNSGNKNSGNKNSGDWNSGNGNSGNKNSGNCNSGDWNSGNENSGNCNSGNENSGNWNSGHWNSGNENSGNGNSGDRNSGNCNSGDWNSGNWNSGDYNSGDWNSTDCSNGCFNTKENKIFIFDKLSDMTLKDWNESKVKTILSEIPQNTLIWVSESAMTGKEKINNPSYKRTGGYLKMIEVTNEDKQFWYNSLSKDDKQLILDIPNFDADKFEKITGIKTIEGIKKMDSDPDGGVFDE